MQRIALLPLLAGIAMAAQADTWFDTARVRSVQPQYESVTVPRQECTSQWIQEQRRVEPQRGYGGAVVGGLAGALVGNQMGQGHGREAATALGAVIGAFAGDRVTQRDRHGERYETLPPRQVQTCQTVNEVQQRVTGYQVTYDYRGQQFSTVLPQDPGPTLQVRVSVDPVVR
ncbi:MAG: glycine zipper 2TM domain-containing protein [Rhodoferax sp.]